MRFLEPLLTKLSLLTVMSTWISGLLRRVVSDLATFSDVTNIPEDVLDTFIVSLERVYRELTVMDAISQITPSQREAYNVVRTSLSTLRSQLESRQQYRSQQVGLLAVSVGCVGRPRFDIPNDILSCLIENGFSVPQIAELLGVSVRTVRRRMSEIGLSVREQYSTITDQELDRHVREIQLEFPMCGNRQMCGHLLSRGFRLQQYRVREAQRRIDPEGSLLRRLFTISRREYSVPAPRSLFYIDGNHKLIRLVPP